MDKKNKASKQDRREWHAITAEWSRGQRTAAWNELWRQILSDVLHEGGQVAKLDSGEKVPYLSDVVGEVRDE